MQNLQEHIKDHLIQWPFINEMSKDELINLSALARRIKPDIERRVGRPVTEAALRMALQRRSPERVDLVSHRVKQFLAELGDISVRSGLLAVSLYNSTEMLESLTPLLSKFSKNPAQFSAFSIGVAESTFIFNRANEAEFELALDKSMVKKKRRELSAIVLRLSEQNTDVPGLYYLFFKSLAERGINIQEVISTTNEFTFLVQDNDVEEAFSAMNRLKQLK